MKVLLACEESQRICIEFRQKGHEAYSCDIQECSGDHPEWHILGDVLPLLNGNCSFATMDGTKHYIDRWDLLIAFPPCTHLASSGQNWFSRGYKPLYLRDEAADFFMKFVNADVDRIAIENPVGIMSTRYKKPTQIIQPYYFGDPHRKATCLWLKGLPELTPTKIVYPDIVVTYNKNGKRITDDRIHYETFMKSSKDRSKIRSKTFPGVAKAMADQWG